MLAPERPFSAAELGAVVEQLGDQLTRLHGLGRWHGQINLSSTTLDDATGRASLAEPPAGPWQLSTDPEAAPPELHGRESFALPREIAAAREQLRARQIALDPVQIDVYQLSALVCRLLTQQSVRSYLRSPRTRSRVPVELRPIVDRALGYEKGAPFEAVSELQSALRLAISGTSDAEGNAATSTAEADTDSPRTRSGGATDTAIELAPARRASRGAASLPIQTLGHYEILERIGHGGMGDVYRAYDRPLDRIVALKVLPHELAQHENFIRRFYAEASAAARLVHPNIIQIYYIGEDAGHYFFAMQYVEGESLAELLGRRPSLTVEETLDVTEHVLSGLAAAHGMGLVHRDVKPGNILLERKEGRALLADFGLVKSLEGATSMTATGVVMGTANYIPPEQARGKAVDGRADLYSTGVVMYQMLAGRLPFAAENATSLIFKHVYEPPPPLIETVPEIDAGLAEIVERLLAKDPAERYQSAEDVLADLAAVRGGEPLCAAAPATGGFAEQESRIIPAPQFDDRLVPRGVNAPRSHGWWEQLRDHAATLFRQHAPEFIKELQTTGQRVDGAVAEYERRQRRLQELIGEAEGALGELTGHAASCRATADAARLRSEAAEGDEATRAALAEAADCARQAQELEAQAAEQEQQIEEMRLRLAQVSAALERLRSQRDILQSRLKTAQAQIRMSGGKIPTRRRRYLRPALGAAAAAVLLSAIVYSAAAPSAPVSQIESSRVEEDSERAARPPASEAENVGTQALTLSDEPLELPDGPAGLVHRFAGHYDQIRDVAFSPQGRYALTGSWDGTVRLWDVQTWKELARYRNTHRDGELRKVRSVAFSPDAGRILRGGEHGLVVSYDTATGEEVVEYRGHRATVWSVAYGPRGTRIASADEQGAVRVWEAATGNELWQSWRASGVVYDLAFSPDGKYLASAGKDRIVRLFHAETGELAKRLEGHSQAVVGLAFAPDGSQLVSGGYDAEPRLWNIESGEEIRRFDGQKMGVHGLAFSHDGTRIASISYDGTVSVWDAATGELLQRFAGHDGQGWGIAFAPNDRYLLTGGADALASLWRLPLSLTTPLPDDRAGPAQALWGHVGPITGVAFSPNGRSVISSSLDGTARVWDLVSGSQHHRLTGHDGGVQDIAVSPGGREAVTAGHDHRVIRWDLRTGRELARLEGHQDVVECVAYSPDGRFLASAGRDRTVRLWEAATGELSQVLEGHAAAIEDIAFSPDSTWLAAAEGAPSATESTRGKSVSNAPIHLWDVATGEKVQRLEGHPQGVRGVAFMPDQKRLLSWGHDQTLRLWDIDSAAEVRHWERAVHDATVIPSGGFGVTADADRLIRVVDLDSGKPQAWFPGHEQAIGSIALSPDGAFAVSGSGESAAPSGGGEFPLWLWSLPKGLDRAASGAAEGIATVTPPTDDEEAFSAALTEAAVHLERDGPDTEAFLGHLQSAAGVLPQLEVGTESRRGIWNRLGPREPGSRLVAYRFTSPLDRPANMYWIFSLPGDKRYQRLQGWYILPAEGTMKGFQRYRLQYNALFKGGQIPVQNQTVFQALTGGEILPGQEYIVWIAYGDASARAAPVVAETDELRGLHIAIHLDPVGTSVPASLTPARIAEKVGVALVEAADLSAAP